MTEAGATLAQDAERRSVRLAEEFSSGPYQLNERGEQLLHRFAFAAYVDLRDAGLAAEAALILAGGRS